jgi:hypothetical protein
MEGSTTLVIDQQLSALHPRNQHVPISPKMMEKGRVDSSFPQRTATSGSEDTAKRAGG